jgi:hypothetical protein
MAAGSAPGNKRTLFGRCCAYHRMLKQETKKNPTCWGKGLQRNCNSHYTALISNNRIEFVKIFNQSKVTSFRQKKKKKMSSFHDRFKPEIFLLNENTKFLLYSFIYHRSIDNTVK